MGFIMTKMDQLRLNLVRGDHWDDDLPNIRIEDKWDVIEGCPPRLIVFRKPKEQHTVLNTNEVTFTIKD